ncbi:SfiI-subtelomeric fragment related protein family member, putative [Theileria annulata]|uniref:SfiI-subtelomeric related protein family member, putative n=1 Tax=Theileria annulata TaxID=5874 RepID=Q4UD79_THEAN|nr:SfiI-subtelomeric fragment related protein family member, putative [Theileria annulata]CAI74960.1 SfiI-subtelomeric fragment related protein family member, putative [Theileria annulata]
MKNVIFKSVLILIIIKSVYCGDKPKDTKNFKGVGDLEPITDTDPNLSNDSDDENFDVTETTVQPETIPVEVGSDEETVDEELIEHKFVEAGINLENEKYILDITKFESKNYDCIKKKKVDKYIIKNGSKFYIVKSGDHMIWKSRNPEVYGKKVNVKKINEDIKTMKIQMCDDTIKDFYKIEVIYPWEEITAHSNEQFILDIENKRGNEDYDFVKNKEFCKYTVREHYKFIAIKSSNKIIWATHNPNTFATEVIVEGSGFGTVTVTIYLNTGIKMMYQRFTYFHSWEYITPYVSGDCDLDVTTMKSTDDYEFVPEKNDLKYICKGNYKFKSIKCSEDIIWYTRDQDVYGIEAIYIGNDLLDQWLTIIMNDGSKLTFYKSTKYEIWENTTAGFADVIRIFAESDEERGVLKPMDSTEYTVTTFDGIRYVYEFHVADCKKISLKNKTVWRHTRQIPYPLFMIFNKQESKITLRFEKSLFVASIKHDDVEKEDYVEKDDYDISELKLYKLDEYDEPVEITPNNSSVELIKENKFLYSLKKTVECTMIQVEDRPVWNHIDGQEHPKSITYNKNNNILNVNFEDHFIDIVLEWDEWISKMYSHVKELKLYTDNGENTVIPMKNELYKINDSLQESYLIELLKGSKCSKVKCKEMTIWRRETNENYPNCIEYDYSREKKIMIHFDTHFNSYQIKENKWVQDKQEIPIIELVIFDQSESTIKLTLDDFSLESTPDKSYKHEIKHGIKCINIKVFGTTIWEKTNADGFPKSITTIGLNKILVNFGDYMIIFKRSECKYRLINVKNLKG